MLNVTTQNFGNVVTLYLRGKVVIGYTGALRNAVDCEPEASAIVLDFARVTTIDAHGLGVLLELRRYAESRGIEFRLTNVTQVVGWVLDITRLNSVFNMSVKPRVSKPLSPFSSIRDLAACA